MSEYLAIFEYNRFSGGHSGVRILLHFKNRIEFEYFIPENGVRVIAHGISPKIAEEFISQTPEIALLASAVEKSSNKAGVIDFENLSYHLRTTFIKISFNRDSNSERKVPYFTEFIRGVIDTNTEKGALIKYIYENYCKNRFGEVDFASCQAGLDCKILEIFTNQLKNNTK